MQWSSLIESVKSDVSGEEAKLRLLSSHAHGDLVCRGRIRGRFTSSSEDEYEPLGDMVVDEESPCQSRDEMYVERVRIENMQIR
jgi:hypothetical protein